MTGPAAPTPIAEPTALPWWLSQRTGQAPKLACWLLAAAVTAFQLGPEWGTPYLAGCDETQALLAGARLYEGEGLTSLSPYPTWPNPFGGDLAQPDWRPMTNWPPGHALLYAAVLSAVDGDRDAAAIFLRLLKTLAALLGAYLWLRLADRVLAGPGMLMFAVLLSSVLHGYNLNANVPLVGPSHLFVWTLTAWWLSRALTAAESGCRRDWLLVGLVAALAVQARFQAVYIVAASAGLAVLLAGGGLRPRLLTAVAAGLPGTLSFAAVLAFNKLLGSAQFWISEELRPVWNWTDPWQEALAAIWVAFGFQLPEMATKIKPSLRQAELFGWATWSWYSLLAVSGLLGGLVLLRREPVDSAAKLSEPADAAAKPTEPADAAESVAVARRRGVLVLMVGVLLMGLCGVLFAAAVRLPPGTDFSPTGEWRYYTEGVPAAGLALMVLWAAVLDSGARRSGTQPGGRIHSSAGRAVVVLVIAGVLTGSVLAIFFDARQQWRYRRTLSESAAARLGRPNVAAAVVEHLCATRPVEDHLVLDSLNELPRWLYWRYQYRAAAVTDTEMLPRVRNSRPTYVVIVVRWQPRDGEVHSTWRTHDAWQTVCFLLGPSVRESFRFRDGGYFCQVYAGVVAPFEPGQRPPPLPRETQAPTPMDLTPADLTSKPARGDTDHHE